MKQSVILSFYRRPAPSRLREFGFTIIEVLIVLAIAGLILLIVFLAVPALQRNSRNTSYKAESSRILAGAQEFYNSHNLTLPVSTDSAELLANANAKSITSLTITNPGTTTEVKPSLTTATLETGVNCGTVGTSSGTGVTPSTGAAAKRMVIIYGIEKNDGTVLAQCTAT